MYKKLYWLFALLAVAYLASIFVEVPNPDVLAQYNINRADVIGINLTAALPFIAIWFTGFYGLINLARYSKKIQDSPDGEAFNFLTIGVAVLAVSLPVVAVISRWFVNAINAGMIDRSIPIIVETHLNVLYPLVGFALLLIGARRLMRTIKNARVATKRTIVVTVTFAVIAAAYLAIFAASPNHESAYRIPEWLTIVTIILPFLAMLACAMYTMLHIGTYHRAVGGKLYKKSLMKLNVGLFFVILALSLIQFIVAASPLLTDTEFAWILALIYFLLILLAIGHVYIARGAKGLTKLEEAV